MFAIGASRRRARSSCTQACERSAESSFKPSQSSRSSRHEPISSHCRGRGVRRSRVCAFGSDRARELAHRGLSRYCPGGRGVPHRHLSERSPSERELHRWSHGDALRRVRRARDARADARGHLRSGDACRSAKLDVPQAISPFRRGGCSRADVGLLRKTTPPGQDFSALQVVGDIAGTSRPFCWRCSAVRSIPITGRLGRAAPRGSSTWSFCSESAPCSSSRRRGCSG